MLKTTCFTRLFLVFIVLLFSYSVNAAYYKNQPTTVVQPNGVEVHCFASGDEYFNFLHDAYDYTIIRNEKGYYCYGIEKDGWVVASEYIVGTVDPAQVGLKKGARISVENYKKKVKEMHQHKDKSIKAPHDGVFNNLVVYIRFSDQTEFTSPRSYYDNKFNPETGVSLKSYFKQVSYNKLYLQSHHYPECALTTSLSYQDPNPRAYYSPYDAVTNPIGYQPSQRTYREHTLLVNAINFIKSQVPTTLNIDADNDGYVDNVCFLIRGNSDNWADLLWGHRWYLFSQTAYINGKRVYDYTFQNENQNDVQTLCHEMFHALGAPDLYHYNYDGFTTVGGWDLMESGFGHMGAYMKYKYTYGNWINDIPAITVTGTYTLNSLDSATNNCYKIASPYSYSEFFVVEYRRKAGTFEGNIPGTGLLVYRINPDAGDGNADGPPDEVYIYRPNGTTTVNGNINSAHFSASVGRTAINDFTNPKSFLTDGSFGGLDISQIGVPGATISFKVTISTNPLPESNFRTSNAYIASGTAVNFTDMSMRSPTSWRWTFDGGTPSTSTLQNPTNIRYYDPGIYNVTLTVSNASGSNTKTKQGYITVDPAANWIPKNINFYYEQRRLARIFPFSQLVAWAYPTDGINPNNATREYCYTGDGGNTWYSGVIGGIDNYRITSISGVSTSRAWVTVWDSNNGGGKVLRTADGGNTWLTQSTATFAAPSGKPLIIHSYSLSTGVCMGDPNGGYFEFYTTTNSGVAWVRVPQTNLPAPLPDEHIVQNCIETVGNYIWVGTDKGRILRSKNKGNNWDVITTDLSRVDRIVFKDTLIGVIQKLIHGFEMKRTTDGGMNWNDMQVTGNFFPSIVEYANGENLWINVSEDPSNCGSSYSLDDGFTWLPIDSGIRYSTAAFYNVVSGYAGTYSHDAYNGGVFKWNNIVTEIKEKYLSQDNVMVYPSLVNDKFYISLKDINSSNVNITVCDLLGRIVYQQEATFDRTITIPTNQWLPGIYLVKIQSNKLNETRKIQIVR